MSHPGQAVLPASRLRRPLCLVGLLCTAAPSASAAPCVPADRARAAEARAAARSQAAYLEALRRQGMEPVTLGRDLTPAEGGDPLAPPERERRARPGAERVVDLGIVYVSCGDHEGPSADFARKGKRIYRIEKVASPARARAMTICACRAHGRGCGVAPRPMRLVYQLPPDTVYAGTKRIPFRQEFVELSYRPPPNMLCAPPPLIP